MVNFTFPPKNDLKEVVGLKAQIFQFSSIFTHILTSPSNKLDTSRRKNNFFKISNKEIQNLCFINGIL